MATLLEPSLGICKLPWVTRLGTSMNVTPALRNQEPASLLSSMGAASKQKTWHQDTFSCGGGGGKHNSRNNQLHKLVSQGLGDGRKRGEDCTDHALVEHFGKRD